MSKRIPYMMEVLPDEPAPVTEAEPYAILNFIARNGNAIMADDNIADPAASLLVVWTHLHSNGGAWFGKWVCELNSSRFVVRWYDPVVAPFNKFLIPLIKRAYPPLIV